MEKLFEEFSPKTLAEWNEKIITDLKGKDYKNLIWESPENIKVAPVYTRESVHGHKGETTHHHTDWEIEQSLNKPSNKQVLASLNGGASALLICNVESKDLESVLENILIQYIQTSIKSTEIENSIEALLELIEKRNLDKDSIKGSLQYDPLMAALKKGSFDSNIWSEFKSVQEKTNSLPAYNSLSIQGQEYHNSGATATQELAFTLAQISEYFAKDSDLKSSKLQVSLGVSTNYFFEIAKFRAMRILWSQILKAYKKEKTTLDLRAETGLRTSTVFDPHVNMLRTTSQCMSAALGGANTVNVSNFNAAYKQDDDFAQRMGRNISLILKEESYFNKVSDPSAGSYYIEQITNELSQNAWSLFQEIEAQGGWIEAVKSNSIQEMIEQNAALQEENLSAGNTQLLGTNLYPNKEEEMNAKLEIPIKKEMVEGVEFKALNTKRLSTQMDIERIAEEKNA
jgi:methylmalonyl-CoA mutase